MNQGKICRDSLKAQYVTFYKILLGNGIGNARNLNPGKLEALSKARPRKRFYVLNVYGQSQQGCPRTQELQ